MEPIVIHREQRVPAPPEQVWPYVDELDRLATRMGSREVRRQVEASLDALVAAVDAPARGASGESV